MDLKRERKEISIYEGQLDLEPRFAKKFIFRIKLDSAEEWHTVILNTDYNYVLGDYTNSGIPLGDPQNRIHVKIEIETT